MRSIFLRVFLWFWLAMALAAALLIYTSPWLAGPPPEERWREDTAAVLSIYGEKAVDLYDRSGEEALRGYVDDLERSEGLALFVLDDVANDLLGRRLSPPARNAAKRALLSGQTEYARGRGLFVAARELAGDESTYLVASEIPARQLVRMHRPRPGALVLRVLGVVLVAGGVCYLLARQLSRPVRALHAATEELRRGNLTARVGPKIGQRQDEIGQLARDFDAMAERLQQLVESQRRLLRDVSHELRSPLTRLEVALDMAREAAGQAGESALERIAEESRRLNELIGQLLALARLESGAGEEPFVELDLTALVQDLVDRAQLEARSRPCTLQLRAPECCLVRGSAELLQRAVENVLRNAVRYTAPGSTVEVVLEAGPEAVELAVRDRGPGVPEAELEHVFRPFYRVADSRDRQSGGSGLGLAIAAHAVRRHAGTVSARNAPDGGLVVTIRLPRRSGA
jgi:two-component system sensor histidine kinase CpxA